MAIDTLLFDRHEHERQQVGDALAALRELSGTATPSARYAGRTARCSRRSAGSSSLCISTSTRRTTPRGLDATGNCLGMRSRRVTPRESARVGWAASRIFTLRWPAIRRMRRACCSRPCACAPLERRGEPSVPVLLVHRTELVPHQTTEASMTSQLDHFKSFAANFVLDNGEALDPEPFGIRASCPRGSARRGRRRSALGSSGAGPVAHRCS